MAFGLTITAPFKAQLAVLPAWERRMVESSIAAKILERPTTPTKAVKRLRPNPISEFELRVGDLRVLYNVVGEEVILVAVGRKIGNQLFIGSEEFHGHQDHSPQSPGNGTDGNSE
jgi:mRNA-degrading endonuclease RelE of RelBE toxin-antitoxin system